MTTKAKTNEVTVSVNGKAFLLTEVPPKKAGKHAFLRFQPAGDCKEVAPFSTIYIPK